MHCWHQNFQQTHQYCEKADFKAALRQIPTPLTMYIIAMFKHGVLSYNLLCIMEVV
jgi:hypothetical protein